MASITDIRAALADAIGALGNIQASPYILANPTPPSAFVYPCGEAGDIEYDQAMHRGFDIVPFTVEVYTGSPHDIAAQVNLDEYLEPSGGRSIKAALEADKTLGGIVDDLRVTRCRGYRAVVMPHRGQVDPILAGTWLVDVWWPGG